MYKESRDCPGGMLGLESEELLLLHAKNTSMAATLDAAVSHLVAVFMLCSLWVEIYHRVEQGCQKPFQNPVIAVHFRHVDIHKYYERIDRLKQLQRVLAIPCWLRFPRLPAIFTNLFSNLVIRLLRGICR